MSEANCVLEKRVGLLADQVLVGVRGRFGSLKGSDGQLGLLVKGDDLLAEAEYYLAWSVARWWGVRFVTLGVAAAAAGIDLEAGVAAISTGAFVLVGGGSVADAAGALGSLD
jgi:hypothetical protein